MKQLSARGRSKNRDIGFLVTAIGLVVPWVAFPFAGFPDQTSELGAIFDVVFSILPVLVSCLIFVTSIGKGRLFDAPVKEVSLSLLFGLAGLALAMVARILGLHADGEWVYPGAANSVMVMGRLATGMTLALLLRLCVMFYRVSNRTD